MWISLLEKKKRDRLFSPKETTRTTHSFSNTNSCNSMIDLHIYHKLHKQESSHKSKTDESLRIKLKRAVTLSRHDYAVRGTWTISVGGHLIEYDRKEHAVLSMFNLRKCIVGVLSQKDPRSNKQSSTYCYFALYGQKVHEPSEKKKNRMKKEYKFRAPWGIAQAVHLELSKFCLCGGEGI